MVMKAEDIVNALGRLEMKGGQHVISESLRAAIIAVLQAKKPVKRSPGGRPLTDDELPKTKGKQPE